MKKIISFITSATIAFSGLTATAQEKDTVDKNSTLYALNIMQGYEDGTLRLENPVTRAEVTKIIIAALAQTQAAESAKGKTNFTDVAENHWASGYTNVGSQPSGFINGMGDGTFLPEGNVTYAQLIKMLVAALGYNGMAVQEGGYPTGYLTVGERIGLTKSVMAKANDELTREQVSILVENALDIPLLVNTVWSYNNPEYEIKDGKGNQYQTLLTEYHNAYKVEGKIIETSKSTSLDSDEIKFEIAVANRFGDDDYYTRNENRDRTEIIKISSDINPEEYLFSYCNAIIQKDENDEFTLIAIDSTSKSKTVTYSAKDFDEDASVYKNEPANKIVNFEENLKFYSSANKTTNYKLAEEVRLWVNGIENSFTEDNINNYIINNKTGTVTLIDAPQEGKATTDGYYDYILVTYYKSAVVSDVLSNGTVYFDVSEEGLPSNIKFDQDKVKDGDLEYHITLDGKEIDFTDLQEDDVLAIAYDVKEKPADSEFYDVIVTRGTVEGKVSSMDSDDEEYTVNGTTYSYDEDLLRDGYNKDAVGMEATLYVDAFGRVVKLEETSSSKKYAILENVWHETGADIYKAKLILPDGSIKDYELKNDDDVGKMYDIAFKDGDVDSHGDKDDITNRVVTYKVNSSNLLYDVKSQDGKEANEEYKIKSNKIGSIKFNNNTKIIDTSDYTTKVSDLNSISINMLKDETDYTAFGYDKLSDGTYNFVIITEGIGGYSDDTQIAIVEKTSVVVNNNDESKDALTVLFEGKEKTFTIDESDIDIFTLNKGDVVTFKLNGNNEIKQINIIASMNLSNGTKRINYIDRITNVEPKGLEKWEDIIVAYGAITDKNLNSITITPYYGKDNDAIDYDINSNTIVYVYDYNENSNNALYVGNKSNIMKTSIGKTFKDEEDNILWNEVYNDETMKYSINYALIRADKEDIQEIFVILAPGEE